MTACALPALAVDPVLMLLMSVARQVIETEARRQAAAPAPMPSPPSTYGGTTVEPEQLKRLVHESFAYLAESRREEIFQSLHATLVDSKYDLVRGAMIEYFAERALAVREAHARLARLSQREKERLASDFRQTVAALPEEEAGQLVRLLRQGLLPLPHDLNELLLAALQG